VSDDKPDALLLDEMFSPAIAAELNSRGVECRAVVADPSLRAHEDLAVLEAALAEGRVLITNNVPDFESLRRAWDAAGRTIPRIIYTRWGLTKLSDALEHAARTHAADRSGGVLWLRPR
jgi:predicted nuclease of predicted toxin-antitoxin system